MVCRFRKGQRRWSQASASPSLTARLNDAQCCCAVVPDELPPLSPVVHLSHAHIERYSRQLLIPAVGPRAQVWACAAWLSARLVLIDCMAGTSA